MLHEVRQKLPASFFMLALPTLSTPDSRYNKYSRGIGFLPPLALGVIIRWQNEKGDGCRACSCGDRNITDQEG